MMTLEKVFVKNDDNSNNNNNDNNNSMSIKSIDIINSINNRNLFDDDTNNNNNVNCNKTSNKNTGNIRNSNSKNSNSNSSSNCGDRVPKKNYFYEDTSRDYQNPSSSQTPNSTHGTHTTNNTNTPHLYSHVTAAWLWAINPLAINICSRGSADSLTNCLVLTLLYFLLERGLNFFFNYDNDNNDEKIF